MESPFTRRIWITPEMSLTQINNRINNINGTRAKSLFRLEQNIIHFIRRFGITHCGFLTLTFPERVTPQEAQRRFNSLRPILLKLFDAYIGVLGFNGDGRPHFHLLVGSQHDIRTGFDEAAYTEFHRIGRTAYHQDRPMTAEEKARRRVLKARISKNEFLKSCSLELSKRLPRYGFGRALAFHVTPIRLNAQAVARYLRNNVVSAYASSRYPKGVRSVRYSQSAPQLINSISFSWNSPGSTIYRRKLSLVAAKHGCYSFDDLRCKFGSRWFREIRYEIEDISDSQLAAWLEDGSIVYEAFEMLAILAKKAKSVKRLLLTDLAS